MVATSHPKEEILGEWTAAQSVLTQFDGYLHDIRKYGFSFVTGLLTADALLGSVLPNFKLAALVGTMALIVVLFVIDKNYRVFTEAASLRATLLERRSSPELTQTITRLYERQRVGLAFDMVYVGLTMVTALLGLLVLGRSLQLAFLGAAYLESLVLLALIAKLLKIRPFVYFEIDGFAYKKNTPIVAVVANFDFEPKRKIMLGKEKAVWTIYEEDDVKMDHPIRQSDLNDIDIESGNDHRWQIDTGGEDLKVGLYRIVYNGPVYSRKITARYFRQYSLAEHDMKKAWASAPRFRIVD